MIGVRRVWLACAVVALTACDHGPPPTPPTALPALERAVLPLPATARDANPYIPRTAFIERGGLPGVFVLDGNGHARFRLVRLGRTAGDRLEVISGLRPGERLVRGDLADVRDGSPITAVTSGK